MPVFYQLINLSLFCHFPYLVSILIYFNRSAHCNVKMYLPSQRWNSRPGILVSADFENNLGGASCKWHTSMRLAQIKKVNSNKIKISTDLSDFISSVHIVFARRTATQSTPRSTTRISPSACNPWSSSTTTWQARELFARTKPSSERTTFSWIWTIETFSGKWCFNFFSAFCYFNRLNVIF